MIKDLTFLHFLTASVFIEAFILYLFRFTKSPLTGVAINRWYDNLGWSAVILDILSFLIREIEYFQMLKTIENF